MKYAIILPYLLLFSYSANAGEIHRATDKGDIKKVSSFLKAGVDPNLVNEYSSTPLNSAISNGDLKIVSLLVKHGAKVSTKGKFIPLIQASGIGHLEITSFLIKHGEDVNIQAGDGYTPLYSGVLSASILESDFMRKEFQNKGIKVKTKEVVSLLLKNGANVNIKNKDGYTPLHWAHSVEVASLLLKYGKYGTVASVNVQNKYGHTPLHSAKSVEIASLLLKHGAKVNIKNDRGETSFSIVKKRFYKPNKWDSFDIAGKFKRNKTQLLKILNSRVPANTNKK